MKLAVVFENENIIAFNKSSGLLSVPDRFNTALPSLFHEANKQYGKLWMVHRLDKETSGIICFAKDEATHRYLSLLFQNRQVAKFYLALVQGNPIEPKGTIRAPIAEHPVQKGRMCVRQKGKPAHTDYEVLESWNNFSLVKLQLHTGRTHQIRVHLKTIGHPVVADPFYGSGDALMLSSFKRHYHLSKEAESERPLLSRLALHAAQLQFKAEDGTFINIEAPLPKDLNAVVKQLNKWNKAF